VDAGGDDRRRSSDARGHGQDLDRGVLVPTCRGGRSIDGANGQLTSRVDGGPAAVLVAAVVLIGLFAGPIAGLAERSAVELLDPASYRAVVAGAGGNP
jgi:hypothetical protein